MTSDTRLLPTTPGDLYARIDANWFGLLLGVTTALVSLTTVYLFTRNPFYINKDSALFQHAGWWITEGGRLYVDIWDLKPPLIYFVTTLLAVVSVGDMALLHVLSIALTVVVVIGGVTLVGALTHRLTDDGMASLVAGVTMFILASLYAFPVAGIRPKYFAFLCGVAGLLLAVDDRPFWSGLIGAAAAGFWQLGAPIGLLVVGIGLQRGGARAAGRAVAGGLMMTALTVLPFVLTGRTIPLFVETVLAPIYGVERYSVVGRLLLVGIEFGYGVAAIPLAIYGWGRGLVDDAGRYWWVAVGGVIYLGQLFLEFQGAIELVMLFVFLALGVGIALSEAATPRRRSLIAVGVVFLVVTSAFWQVAAAPPLREEVEAAYDEADVANYESLPEDPEGWPSMQTIYWEQRTPEFCHYRLGLKQQFFEQQTGGSLYKSSCGQWPYAEPPVQWLRTAILGN